MSKSKSKPKPIDAAPGECWDAAPVVFIQRATCPRCGSDRSPHILRSENQGDGSILRKCLCKTCSRKFKIVVESE